MSQHESNPVGDLRTGRRIAYRGYLIHSELPRACYVIYGRTAAGIVSELGVAARFADAMVWVDRHISALRNTSATAFPMPAAA